MPKASEKEKTFNILEKEVNVISAVNNAKLSPYLDIFKHYPENILLQPLGILTGFFKINDFGDESAYIVNFLSSLLKKEYYANPRRSIDNSFDSALRKVNLALSEIAKEGNINWLGKIEGVVCVLEKNNLHFSVCGSSKLLLIRNQMVTEISKDLSPEEIEPNPLKTFTNVSSGRLEKEDKIIVCSEDILNIFSLNEIKKGANRFPKEKFVQFIKTALTNKLEITGTIIIDLFEKKEEKTTPRKKEAEIANVFSEKTFEKKSPKIDNLKEILKKEDDTEYTDGKTGHIYIQGGKIEKKEKNKGEIFAAFWFSAKEKLIDFYYWLKNKSRRKLLLAGKSLVNLGKEIAEKIRQKMEETRRKRETEKREQMETTKGNDISKENIPELTQNQSGEKMEIPKKFEKFSIFSRFIPNLGRIKEIFSALGSRQKVYTILIIAVIFVLPLVFIKIQNSIKSKKEAANQVQEKVPNEREILSQEKNIVFLESLNSVFQLKEARAITILNDRLLTATPEKIISWKKNEDPSEYLLPENYGKISAITPMEDLNLILIITDKKKVVSWSPASPTFTDNSIKFPENSEIKAAAAYLTYLYIADKNSSQIYRYPRAEGGFGSETEWLKESINFSDEISMAIDENVYIAENGQITKLFKGKIQPFMIEQSIKPFNADKIITKNGMESIYFIDKKQGRIFVHSKDGTLLRQYYNEDIKESNDFTIDETSKIAYIISKNGSISFFNLD